MTRHYGNNQWWARWGMAIFPVALATGITAGLWESIKPQSSPLYCAAVMVSAYYGGLGPGLLATALSGFLTVYVFTEPRYSLGADTADLIRLTLFVAVALCISWLNAARKGAERELRRANLSLEARVAERTGELRQEIVTRAATEESLREHQQRLRELASILTGSEERERRRVAQRLHDELGQLLSLARMRVEELRVLASPACSVGLAGGDRSGECDPCATAVITAPSTSLAAGLEEAVAILDQTVERARSLTSELSPQVFHELGLVPALHWVVERARLQSPSTRIDLQADPWLVQVPSGQEATVLFRSVRELLSNAIKHARPRSVSLRVRRVGADVRVECTDDGTGFDPARLDVRNHDGFGLFSIREHARYLGGEVTVESFPGGGTTIRVSIPASALASVTAAAPPSSVCPDLTEAAP